MSDFNDHWLALRASADSAARADHLVATLGSLPVPAHGGLKVLDLGCGIGANLRHLAPLLAAAGHAHQQWTCVDRDSALLARLPARTHAWADARDLACAGTGAGLHIQADAWQADVAWKAMDLAVDVNRLPLPAGGLVTASALLDLVSERWLAILLRRCRTAGCALMLALSYDGRCGLSPAHPDDTRVIGLVNRHQRIDKGFGLALGPGAAATAGHRCSVLGYRVRAAPSDWHIGPELAELQRVLLDGWRDAAAQMADADAAGWLDDWHAAHLASIEGGTLQMVVGHMDLVVLP
ncbi:MAG: class I SAM-dependent methyltransferase [Thiohalocapsa sp.]|jgi:SAM-dependent methyltransferase|uniref:class I SAM-dependent methyltransferase n=1 Tax=Thiohalocapsa sp. TaxID=2497641 RepID=UPI0025D1EEA7|nr:class I SAM-dependent methyltransferase [Thiohalocapsa sp.]MCG6941787.1 class I SAM-dependent methyltransferase [Thiohalocapsa sp.]